MTFTFKLSRRMAVLQARLLATAVLALVGCSETDSLGPDNSPAAAGDPAEPSSTPTLASSYAGGIPIGTFAQPTSEFGSRFNGAMRNIGPEGLLRELAAIKARGGRVVLMMAGNNRYYKDGGGHFSLDKWKGRVDRYKGINFASYVADGTILGHYLLDEPNDPTNWGGQPVSQATVEEMAKYSKQLWPSMATVARANPSYFTGRQYQYLDAAWAQYLSRMGDPSSYIAQAVSDAQKSGLGLIVGLNYLRGGIPNGTPMTASEVEQWGSALLSSSYPCAFISWQHNSSYLASGSIQDAMDVLRRKAQNRASRDCHGLSGGSVQPPPPSPQPPPPPPPLPVVTPLSGVPFGPYGLPSSAMGSFSGAVRSSTPGTVLATALAARQAGARVVLRLTGSEVKNANGTFSLTKWKAAIDRYAGVDLSSVSGGTIAGHLLVTNPQDRRNWGGQAISYDNLEEMARYSRQRWPWMPTIVQAPASWLGARPGSWQYLDAASVIYTGSTGDAGAWIGQQNGAASNARLGLVVGMNVLNGGTRTSMSASQLQTWGALFVGQSRVCGLMMARYDAAYFGRADVAKAIEAVGNKARARGTTSCRMR